ncbi:MAG: SH3 domain-containing protein [Burkholderiales bacterium]|nr:SH3 domain-containing protein [Burkholderiales bacterium]
MKGFALAGSLLFAASAVNAEPAMTTRATDLLAQAAADAAKIETLSENTKLDLSQERSGKWSKVKTTAGKAGWVSMMSLRLEGGATSGSGKGGNAFAALLNSGRTSANSTGATAAKGFHPDDLDNSQPSLDQLHKMQRYAVSKDAAKSFAQRSKLSAASIEYLKDTSASSNSGSDSGATSSQPTGM